MNIEWLKSSAKLDLHCHLDGSMSAEIIEFLLKDESLKKNGEELSIEQIRQRLQLSPDNKSLAQYLEKFDLPISCIQNEKGLELAAYDLLKNAEKENVRYIEVRFAPMISVNDNISTSQVIEAVLLGIKKAEAEFIIKCQVIVCAMRNFSLESNIEMLKVARNYLGEGVCALDLAGDEAAYPTKEQVDLFLKAKSLEMPYTIHSGETGSVENIKVAVELGAKRLGHGIALIKDNNLMKEVRDRRIGIEMCPTSNLQTKAVNSWSEYPLNTFLDQGLLVSINTDNRTISNTTITKEFIQINEKLGVNEDRIKKIIENSVDMSFADDNLKHNILKLLKA